MGGAHGGGGGRYAPHGGGAGPGGGGDSRHAGPATHVSGGENTQRGAGYTPPAGGGGGLAPRARRGVGGVSGGAHLERRAALTGVTTSQTGKAILDGDTKAQVVTVAKGAKVTIRGLVIRDGRLRAADPRPYGGIGNRGNLTLRDVIVRRNGYDEDGRGIYNTGVLKLLGQSRVVRNRGHQGVVNTRRGRMVLGGSTRIRDNWGYGIYNAGTLVMNGTSNLGNNDVDYNRGTLIMNDRSSIAGRSAGWRRPVEQRDRLHERRQQHPR